MDLNFIETQPQRLGMKYPEETLGKALQQPFNPSNSSSRKQMFNTHNAQNIQLLDPDVPYVSTGYENKYGKLSSSFITTNSKYQVIAKIPKFSNHKDHIFYMIYFDSSTGKYDVFEAKPYEFITEMYGYLIDNSALNRYNPGDIIPEEQVISKSIAYDEYNNREDGVNLLVAYMAVDHTKEDSIIISESAQRKLASPMFKSIEIIINENDIPRNTYGDTHNYKFMPDLLEYTKSNILCGIRRQKNEEAFFAQSEERLGQNQFGDDNFIANGQVIDIDIFCNNLERLGTTSYDDQLKYYYDEKLRLCQDIISLVDSLGGPLVTGYNLQYMYEMAKDTLAGKKARTQNSSVFSNIYLKITVLERNLIINADKLSDRYGGKGVIAKVVPDEKMPITQDGRIIQLIKTKNTVIGRENIGQLWEMHLNHISHAIIMAMRSMIDDIEYCYSLYIRFINMVSGTLGKCLEEIGYPALGTDGKLPPTVDDLSLQEIETFIDCIMTYDYIYVAVNPIQDNMTIDKLTALYEEFPMAKPERLLVPIKNSVGETEYIEGDRPVIVGPIYHYRLKQVGEEKMSATSMSSTNLKGLNTKAKTAKQNKHPIRMVPVAIGNMEFREMLNSGIDHVVESLMLYANSPHARRRCIDLLTKDPFNPNIRLPEEAYNRAAEIFGVFMRTKGMKISIQRFEKSTVDPFVFDPFIIGR